ncbi:unnamed protein product [Spirodela intermedia]|nr:unnamed protein product [Spirodela intermedia]CAA6656793.1 unnamed protein product [Spirodela intermedia]CAA7392722.1 unnamed protein product [Spirodela intermedia]
MDGNLSPNLIGQERSSSKKVARDYSSPGRRPTKEQDFAKNSHLDEALRNDDRKRPRVEENASYAEKSAKLDKNDRICPVDTDSEDKNRAQKTERRPKKLDQKETSLEDESDYDSATERRKELKRRKREERRLRKEEKRRRREERHRKREERRAQKMSKDVHTVGSHPDKERNYSAAEESDEEAGLKVSITTDTEERETDQKKLEIELRKKALESLRAKKAINH